MKNLLKKIKLFRRNNEPVSLATLHSQHKLQEEISLWKAAMPNSYFML